MAVPTADICTICSCNTFDNHPWYHIHNPEIGCTENYLSATIRSNGCKATDGCKRLIITEYMGTDFQNDQFFTRILTAVINMKVDPNYIFTYSGNMNITIYNVQLGVQVLSVNLTDQTATYDSTPITLDSSFIGTFNHNSDNYTIQLFPTYFTLTSDTSGLIFSSNTGTIEPV